MVSVVIETEGDSKNDGGGSLAEMWPEADLLNWIHSEGILDFSQFPEEH